MKNEKSNKIITGIAAATALLVYLYGTKKGKEEVKKLKGWMFMMKGEVIHKLEKLKNINKIAYDKTVNQVSKKYTKIKGISNKEVNDITKILKSGWEDVKKEIGL